MNDYPAMLRAWLTASGLSREQFARRVLLRNPGTLYRWLAGTSPIPGPIRDKLDRRHAALQGRGEHRDDSPGHTTAPILP